MSEIDSRWKEFLKWIEKEKHVSNMYQPDKTSIILWEEFNGRGK